jgi:putative addiction module killer protein
MKEIKTKTIKIYQKYNGDCPFVSWLESLDNTIRHRIKSRLARVAMGNLGDYKTLGDGLSELRFSFSSGYRIYFSEMDDVIVLLLCAGDKKVRVKILSSQKII